MLVSFVIKFIRQGQKQLRNGEGCRAIHVCFWLSLIKLVSKTHILFFLSKMIRGFKGIIKEPQTDEKQTCFCSNLLTSSCVMT